MPLQATPETYPDFHFLLIAPNLGAEWLFDAARRYWERYRPTVIEDYDFIPLIPPDRTITVTVVARRDSAPALGVELMRIRPDAYYDPVVRDTFEETKAELMRRADESQPFGVPIVQPTPTLDPNAPFIPTPRLLPTRPPAGFVTATPSPASPATPDATETPLPPSFTPNENAPAPVQPTRGPITGG